MKNYVLKNGLTGLLLCFVGVSEGSTSILFEPTSYFSERDSPFYGGIIDNTGEGIYLEDFEDQELNTPFVFEPTDLPFFGSTYRSRFPNSSEEAVLGVDGDDGQVDGQPFEGDSWIATDKVTFGRAERIQFDFLPNAQGLYPSYVGIVVTQPGDFFEDVEFLVFDLEDKLIFSDGEFEPIDWAPPEGASRGDPRLHRFIGAYHEDGISSLQMFNVRQTDHLQYGYSIPEPSTVILGLGGMLLSLVRRRRED